MSLTVISFTEKGITLSEKLKEIWEDEDISLFTKCRASLEKKTDCSVCFVEPELESFVRGQMEEKNGLLFIGACGIAVRAIAPVIRNKLCDSPVLVMDEKGSYVIPILSGHMGGANELAERISQKTGAVPVITTATDINKKFAVDLFAKKNGLYIVNREGIARVSAKVLAGEQITMSIETGHRRTEEKIPEEIRILEYPPRQPVDVVITAEERSFAAVLLLKPREYVIGMGCRKGKEADKIETLILQTMDKLGISVCQLLALASIKQKEEEEGFLDWSRKNNIPFLTYSSQELMELTGDFHSSAFVKKKVGVDNVCERAALKACEPLGRLIYEKYAQDGMTIAVARREWRIKFDEK